MALSLDRGGLIKLMEDGGGGGVSSAATPASVNPMVDYLLKSWQGLGAEVGIGSAGTANAEIGGRRLADVAADFANKLSAQGITDLTTTKFAPGKQVAWTAEGHGNVSLIAGPNGRLIPVWGSSSDAGAARSIALALGGAFLAPGLAGALGGGITGGAGAGAILGGAKAAISGGDILKGALTGGITGGVGAGVTQFANPLISDISKSVGEATNSTLANLTKGALTGAVRSGTQAALSGQSIADALLTGGIGGGLSTAISDVTKAAIPEGAKGAVSALTTVPKIMSAVDKMSARQDAINRLRNLITIRKISLPKPGG